MTDERLIIIIKKAKYDKDSMEKLLERFEELINSYTKKLSFMDSDDARQEVRLAIIKAVHDIKRSDFEGECTNYIRNAVKYKYCSLYKKSKADKIEYVTDDMDKFISVDHNEKYTKIDVHHDFISIVKSHRLSERHEKICFSCWKKKQIKKLGIYWMFRDSMLIELKEKSAKIYGED